MKLSSKSSNTDLKSSAKALGASFIRYQSILFFVAVGLLYGFILFRINALSSSPPPATASDTATTTTETPKTTARPRLKQEVVDKIMTLRDNNARVNTLFNDARANPFKEGQ